MVLLRASHVFPSVIFLPFVSVMNNFQHAVTINIYNHFIYFIPMKIVGVGKKGILFVPWLPAKEAPVWNYLEV